MAVTQCPDKNVGLFYSKNQNPRSQGASVVAQAKQPNVVLILADDLGYGGGSAAMGTSGWKRRTLTNSPRMDRAYHPSPPCPVAAKGTRMSCIARQWVGALTGQSATVLPFLKWSTFSEDVLEIVTGLLHAFDEAVKLLSASGIGLVTAVTFEAGDHRVHELEQLMGIGLLWQCC